RGPETLAALEAHDWPGNVRELKNCIERAVLLGTQPMPSGDAVAAAPRAPSTDGHPGSDRVARLLVLPEEGVDLEALTRDLLDQALERTGGNKSRAAQLL